MISVMAHAGAHPPGGEVGLAVMAIAAMIVPLAVLAFLGRAFWRAAKRDEAKPDARPR